jgi:hypothetical protein
LELETKIDRLQLEIGELKQLMEKQLTNKE